MRVFILNIIGILSPKILSLLAILIPKIPAENKYILLLIWIIKLIIDLDVHRPGHSGNLYKMVKGMRNETGDTLVRFLEFLPAVVFVIATVVMRAWIAFVPGVIGLLFFFLS